MLWNFWQWGGHSRICVQMQVIWFACPTPAAVCTTSALIECHGKEIITPTFMVSTNIYWAPALYSVLCLTLGFQEEYGSVLASWVYSLVESHEEPQRGCCQCLGKSSRVHWLLPRRMAHPQGKLLVPVTCTDYFLSTLVLWNGQDVLLAQKRHWEVK